MSMQAVRERWKEASRKYENKNRKICPECSKKLILKRSERCVSCSVSIRFKGKRKSTAHKKKLREEKLGEKNSMWKGDEVGYTALHNWIRRRKEKPTVCEECKTAKPIDLANISQKYIRSVDDFEWLCRKCHMIKDKRLLNLKNVKREKLQCQ